MRNGTSPRSRWEIILDLLQVTSREESRAKKTRIMQKAYLDWRNFQRHFGYLLERGFIKKIEDPVGGTSYKLTERGEYLMKRLKEVEGLLR
jgi:predicted transcriptional regulator